MQLLLVLGVCALDQWGVATVSHLLIMFNAQCPLVGTQAKLSFITNNSNLMIVAYPAEILQ